MKQTHLLHWRPRPQARRTGSTPRLRSSGAASHLGPLHHAAACSSLSRHTRSPPAPRRCFEPLAEHVIPSRESAATVPRRGLLLATLFAAQVGGSTGHSIIMV